ncbi:hypothetical protein [Mucilaginibacter endophyticus]|uniref:hypothetical protein n=1 Tax=Mucilaginibacter endophyticus TaxID=2675003 RepID=UPI000E0D6A25|nr:hypothetical protein [Mucilaginibacter endophyticus]
MDKLGQYILKKAKIAGICDEWAGLVGSTDSVDELLQLYKKGIDFCLEKNFPSNKDLLRLGGNRLTLHGIYIDKDVTACKGDFIVLLGGSSAKVEIDGYEASQLFVKHSSKAKISVYDNAFVVIDCFDNAVLDITASGNSKVMVNVYQYAQVTHNAKDNSIIKVVHKNKKSY